MRKINNSAIMNKSAGNPATTHTHNRYHQLKMKNLKLIFTLSLICYSVIGFSQIGQLIENKALKFTIEQEKDTIEFIIVDTLLEEKKPIFLWCQGSLPVPLFCEIENYGYYFFGGGVSNFDYAQIANDYHLVIISMPKTPILAKKENLNNSYQYIPNPNEPRKFSTAYIKAN